MRFFDNAYVIRYVRSTALYWNLSLLQLDFLSIYSVNGNKCTIIGAFFADKELRFICNMGPTWAHFLQISAMALQASGNNGHTLCPFFQDKPRVGLAGRRYVRHGLTA